MAAQAAFGLGLDRRPAVLGEGDDRAGLERVLRVRRTRPVAGLADGGLGGGGEGDLHAQRMRGVGENLAFLAGAGCAALLTAGSGVGRRRVGRAGCGGEAGGEVGGMLVLRMTTA